MTGVGKVLLYSTCSQERGPLPYPVCETHFLTPHFSLLLALSCLSTPDPFLFGLQGGDCVEVSISKLDTGCPFSVLNTGSGKLLISQAFALDFPQRWGRGKPS